MIYAIIPLSPLNEHITVLSEKIEKLSTIDPNTQAPPPIPHIYKDYSPKIYFVTFQGTARELSDLLGYGDDLDIGIGIVMRLGNNYGYASQSLWEWLEVRNGKK